MTAAATPRPDAAPEGADARHLARVVPGSGAPLRFGAAGCWAWFHPAAGPIARLPVLLCGPVGHEDLAAHASLRRFAGQLAGRGHAVLRFDWPGQGDSAPQPDTPLDADAWPDWEQAVEEGIETLQGLAAATDVLLVGWRLGASLAVRAARWRTDVAGCVALAPVASGRQLWRQWRLMAATAGAQERASDARGAAGEGAVRIGGQVYSAATGAALQALALAHEPVRADLPLLVIDRAEQPEAAGWCQAARAAGAPVEHEVLSGYDALLTVAHRARAPQALLDRAVQWCGEFQDDRPAAARQAPGVPAGAARLEFEQDGVGVCEQPVWIEPTLPGAQPLFGLLTGPAPGVGAPGRPWAVLVLGSGAERRSGVGGFAAALTRRWAARGATCLRLDLAGIGDSPAWPDPSAPAAAKVVYPAQASAQIAAAVAFLRAWPGVREVRGVGLCSGAYHAFHAAAQGVPMDAAVLLNPKVYLECEDMPLDDLEGSGEAHAQHAVSDFWRACTDPRSWRRLLRGRADAERAWRILPARWALARARWQRRWARLCGRPMGDDLVVEVDRALAGGTRLHFVFARHESGLALLRAAFGRRLGAQLARRGATLDVLPVVDHTFATEAGRAQLMDWFERWFDAPPPGVDPGDPGD